MANLSHLVRHFVQSSKVEELAVSISKPQARVFLKGLSGSQLSFVVAALALKKKPAAHLIIANNKEDAAYFFSDLSSLLPDYPVIFFPDSFKRLHSFEEISSVQVLQRTETINKISGWTEGVPLVILTYPEAILEMVVAPEELEKSRLVVEVGEKLDVDTMMAVLVEFGFARTDFVYEPGQFSLRGGIVDLFSFGNNLPYRIELCDDEVESIRTFNIVDQLSNQKLSRVSIIPNINAQFKQHQKVSFLSILPPKSVVWLMDFDLLLKQLHKSFELADKFVQQMTAFTHADVRDFFRERAFVFPAQVALELCNQSLVFVGQSPEILEKAYPSLF